tara:strand:+ start:1554 stop:2264 length:711 start_codon:yes stop_codon:yes gene_type:complete
MQKLLNLLIIIFFSCVSHSYSENISDFQIEGLSVGDNVYDYFTKETINKSAKIEVKKNSYDGYSSNAGSNETNLSETNNSIVNVPVKNLKHYDDVKVSYFSNKKSNFITDITGLKYFKKNNCEGKKKEAFTDIKNILEDKFKLVETNEPAVGLKQSTFHLDNGGSIVIACFNPTNAIEDFGWVSALMLTINVEGKKGIDLDFNRPLGNKSTTGNNLIDIKPRQDKIKSQTGGRIKF